MRITNVESHVVRRAEIALVWAGRPPPTQGQSHRVSIEVRGDSGECVLVCEP